MLHTACSGCHQRCFVRQALTALSPRLRLGLQHLSQSPSDRRPFFSALLRMTGPKRSSQPVAGASSNGDAQATKKGKSGERNMAVELLDFINEAWTQYHAVGPSATRLTKHASSHSSRRFGCVLQHDCAWAEVRHFFFFVDLRRTVVDSAAVETLDVSLTS